MGLFLFVISIFVCRLPLVSFCLSFYWLENSKLNKTETVLLHILASFEETASNAYTELIKCTSSAPTPMVNTLRCICSIALSLVVLY